FLKAPPPRGSPPCHAPARLRRNGTDDEPDPAGLNHFRSRGPAGAGDALSNRRSPARAPLTPQGRRGPTSKLTKVIVRSRSPRYNSLELGIRIHALGSEESMSKSTHLRVSDCRAILRLVGECRDLGDDRDAWRLHFIEQLAGLVDADM